MKTVSLHPARLATVAAAGLLILSACGGTAESLPAAASAEPAAAADPAEDTSTSDSAVFDSSYVHEISVEFDTTEYLAVVDTYSQTGEKEWIEATVTIDGTTYENVGLRLKGNSSLFGLSTDGTSTTGGVSVESPEDLPWLIRLDKYVDDQNHDGVVDFVVRSNNTETSLNEAVALDLLDAAGLASQDAMAVRFSVNGSEESLRLVIEHPDDVWMEENFDDAGALYKAESTGDYSYRGDDPDSYDEVFDQEAGKDDADLTPLIEFLDFVNNSDDATFAGDLDDWLDTDSFAAYLAMQDLIDNFDDIDGPGNNSYLYYDAETGRFTVVPWDHNLAFGVTNGGMGGGGMGGGGRPERPNGDIGTGDVPAAPGDVGPGAGGMNGSNVLTARFLAIDEYAALYQEQLAAQQAELFDSGYAAEVLSEWVAVLESGASDLVSADVIAADAVALGIS